MLTVRIAYAQDEKKWDTYALKQKTSLAFNLFAWKKGIEHAYKFNCPYFLAEESSQVVGILPVVHHNSPLFRGFLVSLPYCDVGGVWADSEEIKKSLLEHALDYARKNRVSGLELRSITMNDLNYEHRQGFQKVRMVLSLNGDAESLMTSFKSKLRSQINKTFRDGLKVKLGGVELLDTFYRIISENMRDLGSPVHSKKWFGSILQAYGPKSKCGVVFLADNTPAAAGIILYNDHTVSIPWASHLRRYSHYNPNMLLYWNFLKFAANNGYQFFDFGRSTPGEGTYNFKAQWGAEPQPLYWERWNIDKKAIYPVSVNSFSGTDARGRNMAKRIIQRMPLQIATFWGSRIRKYISL